MYRKFFGFFIVLILISGCEGQSCVEADDFGEYNTDIISVNSISSGCEWVDNGDLGEGDETIRICLNGERESLPVYGASQVREGEPICKKIRGSKGGKVTCAMLKDYLLSPGSSPSFEFTDEKGRPCKLAADSDSANLIMENLVKSVYDACLEDCINACTSAVGFKYEPIWSRNNVKEKGGYLGIELSKSNKVQIQALGTVVLRGSAGENKNFSVDKSTVQDNKYILDKSSPFTLTGKWCRGFVGTGEWTTNCPVNNRVGEFVKVSASSSGTSGSSGGSSSSVEYDSMNDGSDPAKRLDFLRRGVVILKPLPKNAQIGSDGTYSGPDISPNFDEWECDFNATDGTYTCGYALSDAGEYASDNAELYGMENYFRKKIGGPVVPENVKDFITVNPFEKVVCKTEGSTRKCSEVDGFDINSSSAGGSGRKMESGLVLTKSGISNREIVYPSKLAFRIPRGTGSGGSSSSNSCDVTVTVSGNGGVQNEVVTVYADDAWYFLEDNLSNRIVLGKDRYSTLSPVSNSSPLQNFDKPYKVSIKFDENKTWTDESGNRIPCGDGMLAFFLPQNEVLIDTSGFVSFKNLLSSSTGSGCTTDNEKWECVNDNNNYKLEFSIINPMYDIGRDSDSFNLVKANFYEYLGSGSSTNDEFVQPRKQTINLKDGTWSNSVYVRNGQILRFDDSNWFSIKQNANNNGYRIKSKIRQVGAHRKRLHEGLVLKIEERPAIICKGTAKETYTNLACNVVIDETGNKKCKVSYLDFCSRHHDGSDLTTEQQAENGRYCPFGCHPGITKEEAALYSGYPETCLLTEEDAELDAYKNITPDTCKACYEYLGGKDANIEYELPMNVTQCYDLENYTGAVSNVASIASSDAKCESDDDENCIKNYGNLTVDNVALGAIKLKSIFENGTYGSLEGMELDTAGKAETGVYTDFKYSNVDNFKINSPTNFKFLVIDNDNLDLVPDSYGNNKGEYSFSFTPQDSVSNGAQMSVFIANKDWIEKDGYVPTEDGKFKAWIVKYNMDKNGSNASTYGVLREDSPYEFNSNGILVKKETKAEGIEMSDLSIKGVNDDEYKDLRLFFKIIDLPEKEACDGSVFMAKKTGVEYQCNGRTSQDPSECEELKAVDTVECVDFYSNNSGSYTVQLKTPKDIINSTGYIVRYIMEPILEILDGKTIGILVDHNGKPLVCDERFDSQYAYGGILPLDKVGEPCSTDDSSYGKYCFKTTKHCGANNSNPTYCFLPGADNSRIGEPCEIYDDSNSNEYGNYCYPIPSSRCVIYKTQNELSSYDSSFGKSCEPGSGENCVRGCDTVDANTYESYCEFVNDGQGFLQRFYEAVINDSAYQIILKLCFTLMVMFYGLYYLLGMAELTHGELIRRVIKISFIYLMVGTDGWYYYNKFFVSFFKSGVDYLVFAIAGAFNDSSSLTAAFVEHNFYDKSVLFSGVDKNLALMFSDQVTYKIWGLMFVSFFGWLYVFLIYSSIIAYIMTVANALLLYLTAQFFISMLLSFGPIFFVLMIFEKTKEMFNKWINNLVSFSLEQIFLLTCLSLFNMLVYNIIKFVLSYRVCWRPVWVINIPLLGNIELMSFWKATTASSPSAAASAVPGLFQILLIYLIANLMKKFIDFATNLGSSIGGGDLMSTDLSGGIKRAASGLYNRMIKNPIRSKAKEAATRIARKTIGYKTKEEEKADRASNKVLRKGLRAANRDADRAVEEFKKKQGERLFTDEKGAPISTEKRNEILANVRRNAFKDSVEHNDSLRSEMAKKKLTAEDLATSRASAFTSSNSLVSFGANMLGNSFGRAGKSEAKNKALAEGKKSLRWEKDSKFGPAKLTSKATSDFSQNEIRRFADAKEKVELDRLKKERGGVFNRHMSDKDYKDRKKAIKDEIQKTMNQMAIQEIRRRGEIKGREDATKNTVGASAWFRRNGAAVTAKQKANKVAAIQAKAAVDELQRQKMDEFKLAHPDFKAAGRLNPLRLGTSKERYKFGVRFNAAMRSMIPASWQNPEKRARIQGEALENKRNRAAYERDLKTYRSLGRDAQREVIDRFTAEASGPLAQFGNKSQNTSDPEQQTDGRSTPTSQQDSSRGTEADGSAGSASNSEIEDSMGGDDGSRTRNPANAPSNDSVEPQGSGSLSDGADGGRGAIKERAAAGGTGGQPSAPTGGDGSPEIRGSVGATDFVSGAEERPAGRPNMPFDVGGTTDETEAAGKPTASPRGAEGQIVIPHTDGGASGEKPAGKVGSTVEMEGRKPAGRVGSMGGMEERPTAVVSGDRNGVEGTEGVRSPRTVERNAEGQPAAPTGGDGSTEMQGSVGTTDFVSGAGERPAGRPNMPFDVGGTTDETGATGKPTASPRGAEGQTVVPNSDGRSKERPSEGGSRAEIVGQSRREPTSSAGGVKTGVEDKTAGKSRTVERDAGRKPSSAVNAASVRPIEGDAPTGMAGGQSSGQSAVSSGTVRSEAGDTGGSSAVERGANGQFNSTGTNASREGNRENGDVDGQRESTKGATKHSGKSSAGGKTDDSKSKSDKDTKPPMPMSLGKASREFDKRSKTDKEFEKAYGARVAENRERFLKEHPTYAKELDERNGDNGEADGQKKERFRVSKENRDIDRAYHNIEEATKYEMINEIRYGMDPLKSSGGNGDGMEKDRGGKEETTAKPRTEAEQAPEDD